MWLQGSGPEAEPVNDFHQPGTVVVRMPIRAQCYDLVVVVHADAAAHTDHHGLAIHRLHARLEMGDEYSPVNSHLAPSRGLDEPLYDEIVRFERVTKGSCSRYIRASLTTPPYNCINLKKLLFGIYLMGNPKAGMADKVMLNPVLGDAVNASYDLTCSFTCSHPELSTSRYDQTAGIGAAWNVILRTVFPVASERCLRLTCDPNVFAGRDRSASGAMLAAFARAEADKRKGRVTLGSNSFTISDISIPLACLFRSRFAAQRRSKWPSVSMENAQNQRLVA
ncbi:hypothetical protein [Cypionkella sp.]|uniref:hypothetical protein n=1 Tax=Cypionkella sp. TaxID=2811411 RepID=UPI0026193BE9|nr:hypothetical protein [Cypionkella sp.]